MLTDRRPPSVSALSSKDSKHNGAGPGELDDGSRLKAESSYYSYYQCHSDPDPNATGSASYN